MTRRRRLSVRFADVVRLLVAWLCSTVALMIAGAVLPGFSASSPWAYFALAAVSGVVGLVMRPALVEISARIGWIALFPLALIGQAFVMYAAIQLVPQVSATVGSAIAAAWIGAGVGTLLAYVTTAGTDDGLARALGVRGGKPAKVLDPEVPGVLFVQLDGVPFPVLRWAIQAGAVSTMRRWVSSGDYVLKEWTPQMPCTTPASQLGILHGTVAGVPAFRWYDRQLGRLLVANRPGDARVIEERGSTGKGLLYDDGVSISNLFTGDADRSMLTMSALRASRGAPQTRRAFAWFVASPAGFSRSVTRTIAEIMKERHQARRQIRRNYEPRVHRGWDFAVMRSVTNALLRDLNTALVAEEMRRGTKSIYVDYVDYDEIAHHAGLMRPESLSALDGVDGVLATLEELSRHGARKYHIVVLSDHGQAQGKVFADRFGYDLSDLCADLMGREVRAVDADIEGLGRARSIVTEVGGGGGVVGKIAGKAEEGIRSHYEADDGVLPVVLGSGNLGLFYVPGPQRLSLDELDERWPDLVSGLAAHPGIGFVAGLDREGTAWAIGPDGRCNLDTGAIDGIDPLLQFAPHARRVLVRAVHLPEAPDLYLNSVFDPETLEVAAFEGLVGAHGGLGGWQDRAMLLVPKDLAYALPPRIEGADELHRLLVDMLCACGHRREPSATQPSAL